ncbi:hypothetical protein QF86_004175 [Salmonella enterica subsp. salamae]|uniref:Uncharacterized protein n=1 Tax=Salmonella enterica TaxID=28901 RepID=A0A743FQR6_SALER|nr:hypothetical protein [Salmonella enterica subsp. enterica]EDT7500815.1 hypothetical protein [Salmonella enterica subsp. enterica serovar Schleissheim]EDV4966296.1 hypothetical protein [Salmonella enterica subsp. salamae]HAF1934032.1 hypothetical protein [Salmonella enterica]
MSFNQSHLNYGGLAGALRRAGSSYPVLQTPSVHHPYEICNSVVVIISVKRKPL